MATYYKTNPEKRLYCISDALNEKKLWNKYNNNDTKHYTNITAQSTHEMIEELVTLCFGEQTIQSSMLHTQNYLGTRLNTA